MKKLCLLLSSVLLFCGASAAIITTKTPGAPGSWTIFSKSFTLKSADAPVFMQIAADSKYWLWVNGELNVFEGGIKRGPTPTDTYVDVFTSLKGLKPGRNKIDILLWYFGKDGFSHKSRPVAGIDVLLRIGKQEIMSDGSWKALKHPAYYVPLEEKPNFRLSESNIGYDGVKHIEFWKPGFVTSSWPDAVVVNPADAQWGKYVPRPIPQWKDSGLKPYTRVEQKDSVWIAYLPYNAQVTPYLRVKSPRGKEIDIRTDNYNGGSEKNVYARYRTRNGVQSYESLGWMNGHQVIYTIPRDVKVLELAYRETGFNCELDGAFSCADTFYMSLWKKAQRTLYITMRDSYMDCPDRERAQWWGDVVNELGEAFYAMDANAHQLTRKGILELAHWQRADSTLYAPVPSGSWNKELPMQMLASVGYYGFWTYFMGTGDTATIKEVYPFVQRYMHKWTLNEEGLVVPRKGGWSWGDWGKNQDMELLFSLWYDIALDGYNRMSRLLSNTEEASWAARCSSKLRDSFHKKYWNGKYYISPEHKGEPDDRAQALAVVSGIAPAENYPLLRSFFKETYHASPYMEKYVLQALCQMGYSTDALDRMKLRYAAMVASPLTTLWEGWDIGSRTYGGGTYNHAWSGGSLTILSQYIGGISTQEPRFKRFEVNPQLGSLRSLCVTVPTVFGVIDLTVTKTDSILKIFKSNKILNQIPKEYRQNLSDRLNRIPKQDWLNLSMPEGTTAEVVVPVDCKRILLESEPQRLTKRLILKPGRHKIVFEY